MSFSNESNLNPRIQSVITHEPQTTGGSSPEDDGNNPNKKSRYTLRQKLGALAAGIAVAAGAAVGVGVAASHSAGETVPKAVESSAPADPTQEAAQPSKTAEAVPNRFTGSDFERTDELPASLKEANEATPEEFVKLPKKIQIQWATWAGQYKQDFIKTFASASGLPEDQPYSLTKDSDAKTLIIDRDFEQRIAANFGTGTPESMQTNGAIDSNMIKKYLLAFTVTSPTAEANVDGFINSLSENTEGQAENVVQQARRGEYDSTAEIAKSPDFIAQPNTFGLDGEEISGYLVHWKTENGSKTRTFSIGAFETVDYKNQPIVVTVVEQPNE